MWRGGQERAPLMPGGRQFAGYQHSTKREGIVCADDFQAREPEYYRAVMDYARRRRISVIGQAKFAKDYLLTACYKGEATTALVGFNLFFDLSRIAYGCSESRAIKGGFTFYMFPPQAPCGPDCHQIHKHIKETCAYNCTKDKRTHAHVDPPCPTDCELEHHTTKCKTKKERVSGPSGTYSREILDCDKRHKHIQPYCPDDCGKEHQHKPQPCETNCKKEHEHRREPYFSMYEPPLRIKHLDSKKAFIQWGAPAQAPGQRKYNPSGQFIDLRQLIFGMTNRAVSLAGGCKLYSLPEEYCKTHVENYEVVNEEFIDYARQDTRATEALAVAVLSEYMQRHYPATGLPPTRIYSPATIGKAYLGAMGITPMLQRGEERAPQNNRTLGYCTSTFYGARTEVHIRRIPLPVTVCDFTNMYGSVNMRMKLWEYQTAARIDIDDSAAELSRFSDLVADVAAKGTEVVLDQSIWPGLVGFAQVIPEGDILPVRARYSEDSFNVGHNVFSAANPVWYTYADILVSALLTGKVPRIVKAMRFKVQAEGKLPGLKPVIFGGVARVDPEKQDLFRTMIEERAVIKARLKAGKGKPSDERDQEFLKVGVNAPSYGINVEMEASEEGKPGEVAVFGQYEQSWTCVPERVEQAGEYCYPPIGAVITGAARLMLALLEKLIADAGGTWMFGDTDSMALVTTATGGLVACPGGDQERVNAEGVTERAVRALSRAEVARIRDTINRLNPYDRSKVAQLLKDETEDFNKDGQVYGFAISAKRYCLFFYEKAEQGTPDLGRQATQLMPVIPADLFNDDGSFRQAATVNGKPNGKAAYMQHGLGLYLNPDDLNWSSKPGGVDNGHWMRQAWQWILDRARGLSPTYPAWADRPALARYAVTSPAILRCFSKWNEGKSYSDQVKPFNFLLMATEQIGSGLARAMDTDTEFTSDSVSMSGGEKLTKKARRLLAPHSRDPAEWMSCDWYNLKEPEAPGVKIGTVKEPGRVLVKSHRKVLDEYETHPEIKSAMPGGQACCRSYSGLLGRRIVRCAEITHVGKEANKLEEAEADLITIQEEMLTIYPRRDREIVRRAFGPLSNREIARLVNEESDQVLRKWGKGHLAKRHWESDKALYLASAFGVSNCDNYGWPVEIDDKVIARYFRGARTRLKIDFAIVRTAAKKVAPRIGRDPEIVCYVDEWRGSKLEGSRTITPNKVLGIWHEVGMPSGLSLRVEYVA